MLARATVTPAELLLVDEPTAQLDTHSAATVIDTLGHLADAGRIVIIATHDPRGRHLHTHDHPGADPVRLGDLVTEAWRNTRLEASRALLAVAVLGPVVLALAWLDISQVAAVQREANTYRQAGAATYVITSDGQIDGARCDALAGVAGVRAAGALRTAGAPFVPTATPANAIPQYDMAPGLAHQLDPGYATGVALDARHRPRPGDHAPASSCTHGANAAVVATYDYPADGRDRTSSYAP